LDDSELLARESQREAGKKEPGIAGTNRRTTMLADFWRDLRYGATCVMARGRSARARALPASRYFP
jgi:hypothetical protein